MPMPRAARRPVACVAHIPLLVPTLAALVMFACQSSSAPTQATPASSTTPSASASPSASSAGPGPAAATSASAAATGDASGAAENDDGTEPNEPGDVNQRDSKGNFVTASSPPPPAHDPPIAAGIFDSAPDDAKLTEPKDVDGHCGEIDLGGGDQIPLDCLTDDYSMVVGAAKPVASSDDLTSLRNHRKLPSTVDHRKDGTEGPMLNQGKTATCTAFSLVTAANHAANHYLGHAADLSPMHAWARYHSPKMALADRDNVGKGLADLQSFPFDARLASDWQHGRSHVSQEKLHHADQQSLVDITNITRLDGGNMNEIKSALAAGQDVWFAIKAAHGMVHTKKKADGESVISNFDWRSLPSSQRSAHATVLAGYEETPHGTFYLIHNSWGRKWGTDGYAWIWEKTLRSNIADAYVLQVRPTELAHSHRSPQSHRFSKCHNGLAPDAVTGQCVPACADGGPRVNRVCPKAGECPDGEVNLDGKCDVAAPVVDKTLSNGVKVKCGLSGCTYIVPNGQESCRADHGCTISCASPRYMLGSGSRGLVCNG